MTRCRAGGLASRAPSPQCCPNYGVRTDVTRFKPSKNHKKALRRFSRFLAGVRDVPGAAAGKGGRIRNTAGKGGGNTAAGEGAGGARGAPARSPSSAAGAKEEEEAGHTSPVTRAAAQPTKAESAQSQLTAALYTALGRCMEAKLLPALDLAALKVEVRAAPRKAGRCMCTSVALNVFGQVWLLGLRNCQLHRPDFVARGSCGSARVAARCNGRP